MNDSIFVTMQALTVIPCKFGPGGVPLFMIGNRLWVKPESFPLSELEHGCEPTQCPDCGHLVHDQLGNLCPSCQKVMDHSRPGNTGVWYYSYIPFGWNTKPGLYVEAIRINGVIYASPGWNEPDDKHPHARPRHPGKVRKKRKELGSITGVATKTPPIKSRTKLGVGEAKKRKESPPDSKPPHP